MHLAKTRTHYRGSLSDAPDTLAQFGLRRCQRSPYRSLVALNLFGVPRLRAAALGTAVLKGVEASTSRGYVHHECTVV